MLRGFTRLGILGLFGWAALRVSQVWDQLPPYMASHFGAGGAPDAFVSKSGFFVTFAVITAFVTLLLLGLSLLIAKLPVRYINLPNREHWLSEEKKAESIEWLGRGFDSFALATAAFSIGVLELVIRANLNRTGLENGPFLFMLSAYLLFTSGWTIWVLFRFNKPEVA